MKVILTRILTQELKVAAQLACVYRLTASSPMAEKFMDLAKDELRHFAEIVDVLEEFKYEAEVAPFPVPDVSDGIKTMILLMASEDTLIHLYENAVKSPRIVKDHVRKKLLGILEDERDHLRKLKDLIAEAKSDGIGAKKSS